MPARLIAVLLSLGFVMAPSAPSRAEDAEPAIDCDKAVATAELNACADKELAKADAELNTVYAKVRARISKTEADPPYDAKSFEEALRKSQRAWVAYRDADCKDLVPMSWTGGSGTSGEVLGCLTSKTKARTKDLAERYLLE